MKDYIYYHIIFNVMMYCELCNVKKIMIYLKLSGWRIHFPSF